MTRFFCSKNLENSCFISEFMFKRMDFCSKVVIVSSKLDFPIKSFWISAEMVLSFVVVVTVFEPSITQSSTHSHNKISLRLINKKNFDLYQTFGQLYICSQVESLSIPSYSLTKKHYVGSKWKNHIIIFPKTKTT